MSMFRTICDSAQFAKCAARYGYREGGIRLKLGLWSGLGSTVSGRVGFRVRVMY